MVKKVTERFDRILGVNNMKNYKIAVAGTGYVGLSIATLLAQHQPVWIKICRKIDEISRKDLVAGVIGYDSTRKHLAVCGYHTVEIREKYYL